MSDRDQTFGELLIQGAREALAHKRGHLKNVRVTRRARVTARAATAVPPPVYAPERIRRVRGRLGLSQAVFAELIGASRAAVRAWEQGVREPSEMARRLLQIAERNPEVLAEHLRRAS